MSERHRHFMDFAIASLLRRKRRTAILILVSTLAVFILVSAWMLMAATQRDARRLLGHGPDLVVQKVAAGRQTSLPLEYLEGLSAIPGVSAVRGRVWGYYYDPVTGANLTMIGDDGRNAEKGTVIAGPGVARVMEISEGDTISLRGAGGAFETFEVREILPPASEIIASDTVIFRTDDLRELTALQHRLFTDAVISLRPGVSADAVSDHISSSFPGLRAITARQVMETYDNALGHRTPALGLMLAVLAPAFFILLFDKASGMGADEQREIGIMKGLGWQRDEIVAMKCWEGIILSTCSVIPGMLFAYGHIYPGEALFFRAVLQGWEVLMPQPFLLSPPDVIELAALAAAIMLPYAAATALPALRASAVAPDALMRLQ